MEIKEFLEKHELNTYEHMSDVLSEGNCPFLVKGCSGSGKTTRFLTRIAYLLETRAANENNMLNLVYDVNTARRMSKQFTEMFGDKFQPVFSDMFSFCYRIVKFYDENNGHAQRTVYRDMEKAAKRILEDNFQVRLNKQEITRLLQKVNECKNKMLSEKDIAAIVYEGIDFADFYNAYEKFKKNKKIYDQGDVIHEALHILMYDTEIVELYRERFQYFNIDDAQELSYASHMIIRMLHAQRSSLCAFMDETQSIDIDNSAEPQNFDMWKDYYGEVAVVELNQNHRMNKTITKLAGEFRYKENNKLSSSKDSECDIKYKGFSEWKKMYDYALRTVKESPEETAFLYREGAYAIPLIEIFKSQDIPVYYHCNIKKFLTNRVVKDLTNFISLFHDPRNMRAYFEIHEKMGLDMSNRILLEIDERLKNDDSVDVYQAIMESGYKAAGRKKLASNMEDIRFISTQPTLDMIQYVLDKMNYTTFMKENLIDLDDANLLSFKVLADRYPDAGEFLQMLKGLVDIPNDEEANITISDIFFSKGQQYSRVCIIDCFASVYPKPCTNDIQVQAERNLFYVAMSRAMNQLEFFTSKHCFQTRLEMSPFIYELHGKNQDTTAKPKASNVVRKLKESELKRGVKIQHTTLGVGKIMKVKDGMMQVHFETEDKMLNVKMCITNKLIELV
ncbi:MAG: ATP-dependent helicase [Longicatena sp.]